MPFSWADLLWGFVLPFGLAAVLRLVLGWLAARRQARPDLPATAEHPPEKHVPAWETCFPFVVAAASGYLLLNLGPLWPKAHYHWLPAAVGLGALIGMSVDSLGRSLAVRRGVLPVVYAGAVITAGYMLMPTWEDLWPRYEIYLPLWCLAVWLVALALEWQPAECRWPVDGVTVATCLTAAVIAALAESLRFAQIAGLNAAAALGLTVAAGLLRRAPLAAVGLPLSIFLGAILLISHVNSYSDVPFASYGLALAGPLLAARISGLSQGCLSSTRRIVLVLSVGLLPLILAVILAAIASLPETAAHVG